MKLLVVEDQKDLNDIICRKLRNERYVVDSCFTGDDAMLYIKTEEYDGIILDIMLPGITGIGVLERLRASGKSTPVLLLSALGTVEDRVAGLDAGADDYLVKPFDFTELIARIRAMTRRNSREVSEVLTSGDLVVNLGSRTAKRGDRDIELTSREFDILVYLMRNEGIVLSRDKLLNAIWQYDYDGNSNVVDVYMHHVRKKVDGPEEEKKIKTVKGVGYVLK